MHTDAERNYAAKAARIRRASRGRKHPTRLHTDAERKHAAKAALSYFIKKINHRHVIKINKEDYRSFYNDLHKGALGNCGKLWYDYKSKCEI